MVHIAPENTPGAMVLGLISRSVCRTCGVDADRVLRGREVFRLAVEALSAEAPGRLICFWGEGADDGGSLLGWSPVMPTGGRGSSHPVIDSDNVALYAQAHGILAVACHSARVLGHEARRQGVGFYFGFTHKYNVNTNNRITLNYRPFHLPLIYYHEERCRVQGGVSKRHLRRCAVALRRRIDRELSKFVRDGCFRARLPIKQVRRRMTLLDDGNLAVRTHGLSPATTDGFVMAAYGSQNLEHFEPLM